MEKDKKEKIKNKISEVLGSAGYTSATFCLTAILTGLTDSPDYLKYYTGAIVIGTPVTYGLSKLIKQKQKQKRIKKESHLSQLFLMNIQLLEPDYQITSIQTIFHNEISEGIKAANKNESIDFETININQFLYLINSNYYEQIKGNNQNLSREKLINLLITQIMNFYKDEEGLVFNEKTAKKVLANCFFINDNLKKEIYKEFKKSKIRMGKEKSYAIVRKDIEPTIDAYSKKNNEERQDKVSLFDIDDTYWYYRLINIVVNDENMQEYYGHCEKLKWDVKFFKEVITLTARKHKDELIEAHDDYTNFYLALTLAEKATSYAMVNKKETVGKEEILKAFKAWDYVPFSVQMDVLDDILLLEELDYDLHPYGKRQKSKPKENVFKISDYNYKKI